MNCQDFESIVNELARAGTLEKRVREEGLAHSQDCRSCKVRMQGELLLTQGLRALAVEMGSAETPGRIEESLRAAFRRHRFAGTGGLATTRRWQWLTAAAVLLIVSSLAALHLRRPPPLALGPKKDKIESTATVIKSPTNAGMATRKSLPIQITSSTGSSKRKASTLGKVHEPYLHDDDKKSTPKQNETAVAENTKAEIATDFLPVGYPSSFNLQDGGQIVRVELPRSTLATFGLPVNMDRYHQKVKADVLFGADGQARAIRFVQ